MRNTVTREGQPGCFDIHAVQAGQVWPEYQLAVGIGDRRVAELLLQLLRDLKATECFDQPLWRTPPDAISAPDDVIGTKGIVQLAEQMTAAEIGEAQKLADAWEPTF